jgi:hypothetical protein
MTETTNETTPVFEKGSWQETLHKSSVLADRSAQGKKRATALLWAGAQAGIAGWVDTADSDQNGERLYNETMDALGKHRKGDASKIKTVALAVVNNALDLSTFPNLSQAYAAATALTKTVKVHAAEDEAAEAAVEAIAADVPKSASTAEAAAKILLAKGLDGAVVALLDALGANNEQAHRALMRAVSVEVAARVTAKANAEKAAQQAERDKQRAAQQAEKDKAAEAKKAAQPAKKAAAKAPAKSAATKAKPVQAAKTAAKPVVAQPKAKPVVKGKPVVKAPTA